MQMITIKDLIVSGDIHPSSYDTIPSFLAKTFRHEVEIALELGDPRVGYADDVEAASRLSALFGCPVLEFRYPRDGIVCPAFDLRVLQAVLLGGPAPAKLLKRAGAMSRK